MARVAEKLSDVAYVTSDNPRTEEPQGVIDEIVGGFSGEVEVIGAQRSARGRKLAGGICRNAIVDADRRAAIERAISDSEEGDVVLLAGKGHENYQIIGTEKRHFDDVEEATRAIQARTAVNQM